MLFSDKKVNPREYSPLPLAYIGDSVYDLFIRTKVIEKGNRHVTDLHKESVKFVKAHSQAVSVHAIEDKLTEEELQVMKRGRNAKSTPPKNADHRYKLYRCKKSYCCKRKQPRNKADPRLRYMSY